MFVFVSVGVVGQYVSRFVDVAFRSHSLAVVSMAVCLLA